MKKSILNLGTVLNKTEQKMINGGNWCPDPTSAGFCASSSDCIDPTEEDDGMGTWVCELVFPCNTGYCTVV